MKILPSSSSKWSHCGEQKRTCSLLEAGDRMSSGQDAAQVWTERSGGTQIMVVFYPPHPLVASTLFLLVLPLCSLESPLSFPKWLHLSLSSFHRPNLPFRHSRCPYLFPCQSCWALLPPLVAPPSISQDSPLPVRVVIFLPDFALIRSFGLGWLFHLAVVPRAHPFH